MLKVGKKVLTSEKSRKKNFEASSGDESCDM
jgi:hypothetical protein